MLSSRLIDGQFPNYRQLLPESVEHELRLASAELTDVVRRISLLAQKNAPLRLSFSEGTLDRLGADPRRRRGQRGDPRPVPRRAVRDRLQPRVPPRRPREHRVRRARAEADQPAAPGADRIARHRRLRLPDHADPPQRVTASTMRVAAASQLRDFRTYARAEAGSARPDGRPRAERRRQVEPAGGALLRLHRALAAHAQRARAGALRRAGHPRRRSAAATARTRARAERRLRRSRPGAAGEADERRRRAGRAPARRRVHAR